MCRKQKFCIPASRTGQAAVPATLSSRGDPQAYLGLSGGQAHVAAAPRALTADEVVSRLVLAAHAAFPLTDVATARALRAAQELRSVAIGALGGTRVPASTLRVLCHWVVQALGLAALAAGCLAGVATAFVVLAAHKVMTLGTQLVARLAASATGPHADVTTAGAALTTLERVAVAVVAGDGSTSACRALGNWVLVACVRVRAALGACTSASVAAALAARPTREIITVGVLAAKIALGPANVSTALSVAAREDKTVIVDA